MTVETSSSSDIKTAQSSGRLASLDWLRGIASVWVLFYHIDITMQKEKYFAAQPLSDLAAVGYRGVDLFFVLSGFVMTLTLYGSKKDSRVGAIDFAIRRIFRIFPLYLLVFVALFFAAAITGIGGPDGFVPTLGNFVWNALLLPRDDLTTYMPVSAWTLTHELMFYTICIFGFYSKRVFWVLLGLWSSLCLIYFALSEPVENLGMPLSPLNIYFLLGAMCAMLPRYYKTANSLAWLGAGVALLAGAIYVETAVFEAGQRTPIDAILYAAAFFAITFAMSIFNSTSQSLFPRMLHYLGKISYALYLLHYPIIVVVAMVVVKTEPGPFGQFLFISVSIGATLVASALSYKLIESPGIATGRIIAARATGRSARSAVAV